MDFVGKRQEYEKKVYSVSELTGLIKGLLESNFPHLWVEGEISNFTRAHSGHCYFTLKDENAQLSCVIFRNQARLLSFSPSNGAHVQCRGRINVYEPRGNYQFIGEWMEDRGAGRLRELYEKLKAQLESEGLFDDEHKKTLPFLPRTIALVTSPRGAAVRDMIKVIHRRNPHTKLIVIPVLVQGESAAAEIVDGLRRADQIENVDLIIVGRGGGSLEDLWAFNEEPVARAIFECETPVISAVGHEVDFSIADYVADKRAATPSVAGEIAVPEYLALKGELSRQGNSLYQAIRHIATTMRLELKELAFELRSPDRQLSDMRLRLDSITHKLYELQTSRLNAIRRSFASLPNRLMLQHPARKIRDMRYLNKELESRLIDSQRRFLADKRNRLVQLASKLDALSPLAVMERGYSLALDNDGNIVSDATRMKIGDKLLVRMHVGEVAARVESINIEED